MRLSDYLNVSFGNIRRQKLRSGLTMFAVVIGATSVTIMLAVVIGAKGFVKSQFEKSGAMQQVLVTQSPDLDYDHARFGGKNDANGIKLTDAMVRKIQAIPHVKGVTPIAHVHVFDSIAYQGKKLTIEQALAYEPNGVIQHTLVAGRELAKGDGKNTAVITAAYAKKFGFKGNYEGLVGKTVAIETQPHFTGDGAEITQPVDDHSFDNKKMGDGRDKEMKSPNPNNGDGKQQKPTVFSVKILGIVTSDNEEAAIYVPLAWGKQLLVERHWQFKPGNYGQPGQSFLETQSEIERSGYSSITVLADKTSNVEPVATAIRKFGVGAATAKDYVGSQLAVFNIVGLVLGGIGAIALFVAAIGVINTMVMAIMERTREIGVMRACGATRKTIRRLFTFEAAMLGFWGGVMGLLVGYGLTFIINSVINNQMKLNSIKAANIVAIPPWLIVAVVGTTSVIGLLSGLYPASRAARLNPVEALRHE